MYLKAGSVQQVRFYCLTDRNDWNLVSFQITENLRSVDSGPKNKKRVCVDSIPTTPNHIPIPLWILWTSLSCTITSWSSQQLRDIHPVFQNFRPTPPWVSPATDAPLCVSLDLQDWLVASSRWFETAIYGRGDSGEIDVQFSIAVGGLYETIHKEKLHKTSIYSSQFTYIFCFVGAVVSSIHNMSTKKLLEKHTFPPHNWNCQSLTQQKQVSSEEHVEAKMQRPPGKTQFQNLPHLRC